MTKKSKAKSTAPKIDPYVEGFMNKLLERLTGLERKMDAVLSALGKSSVSNNSNNQSKPIQVPQQTKPQQQRPERQLYEAICAACSKVCEVPFRPTESRPVYCKECWAKKKSGGHSAMPVIRPVAPAARVESQLGQVHIPQVSTAAEAKSPKKSKPAKKAKKKK